MKKNTKSSITLPAEELALVVRLMKQLGAKSKVDVIRRGLRLLRDSTEREQLRAAYAEAARKVRDITNQELKDLDHLNADEFEEGA